MDEFKELLEITKELTVLYVEDEKPFRLVEKLQRLFKQVVTAEDGQEGWEKYSAASVDIILTDYLMPILNGLELIKKIREVDRKIPIILITGYIESEFLIDAINQGVTQFVTKPILLPKLLKAIEIAVQQGVLEKLAQKTQEQELELLRYREKYHSSQQEMAFMKELKIIKNDLLNRKIEVKDKRGDKVQWHVDMCYIPLDILSGDSYSIREIAPGRILMFITDAMGKGLSASVTTILTTSFVNHLIDESIGKGAFNFKEFLHSYTSFIKKELLREEIVCAAFVYIDFVEEAMETALFSMPPLLVYTEDQHIVIIKSNNIPIMKYLFDVKVDRHDISGVRKILVYSDGLNEAAVNDKESIYQEFLEEDFRASNFKDDLYRRFGGKVNAPEDDVTFIFLKKIRHPEKKGQVFAINTRLGDVIGLTPEVERFLMDKGVEEPSFVEFINSLTEIVMNAYEHGNLGIDFQKKVDLMAEGNYEGYLLDLEKKVEKNITIAISVYEEDEKVYLVGSVTDEGNGFDLGILNEITAADARRFSGRGLRIVKTLADILLYNKAGNEALLIKTFDKGE